jgi:hypothetical protein
MILKLAISAIKYSAKYAWTLGKLAETKSAPAANSKYKKSSLIKF